MPIPLLQTKLFVPPLASHLVARPALTTKLHAGALRPLTLIAAPAGFGKTTLVSQWIAHADHPVAWLSLDDDDNDPIRFLTYVIAALQSRRPGLGETALALLAAPQPPAPKTILTLLLNELETLDAPLALVLDDYHVVTAQPIHDALTFLIDHLPPALRLIVTSRTDLPLPLARLRARRHLTEIRAADLRFTTNEVIAFFEGMGLTLSEESITALETRTEGWVAGLQLAGLSMQGRGDVAGFIQAFSGSHRHVLSYLMEEVLYRCSTDTLNFLLQTSILDRMSASLCNAVTGRSDGQTVLEQLEQANLFIIPLDDVGQWHRYHQLFADVLHARLQHSQADTLPMLHRRACAWYEEHQLLDQAMRHALASADLDLAVRLVEQHATTLLLQSELLQLRTWVAQLPNKLIQTRPRLTLAHAWVLALVGELTAAEVLLNSASLEPLGLGADVAGELALLRAVIAGFRSDPLALTWAQQALELLPLSREDLRVTALNEVGLAYMRRGELATARRILLDVVRRAEAGDIRFVAVDALATLHIIQVRQGQLFLAVQTCQQALDMVARWVSRGYLGAPPATGMIYIGLGEILAEWNDLVGATQALDEGLRLLQATIEKMPLARGYSALARARQAAGDVEGAQASFAQGEAWFAQLGIIEAPALAWLAAHRARLWLRQGNLTAVARWAEQCDAMGDVELGFVQTLTRVRLWLAQTRQTASSALLENATTALAAVLSKAEAGEWMAYVIESWLLHALLLHTQHDLAGATTALERALTLAHPGGYLRLFVDEGEAMRLMLAELRSHLVDSDLQAYVTRVLAAFSHVNKTLDPTRPSLPVSPQSPAPPSLIEPLTDRELEILRLVADGLSNSEIAARLIITVGTVKKHLNNIFGKLDASSRTQALAHARALQLL